MDCPATVTFKTRTHKGKQFKEIYALTEVDDMPEVLWTHGYKNLHITRFFNPLCEECGVNNLPNLYELRSFMAKSHLLTSFDSFAMEGGYIRYETPSKYDEQARACLQTYKQ